MALRFKKMNSFLSVVFLGLLTPVGMSQSANLSKPTQHLGCVDDPLFKGLGNFQNHAEASGQYTKIVREFDKHGHFVKEVFDTSGNYLTFSITRDEKCRPKLIQEAHGTAPNKKDGLITELTFKFDNKANRLEEVIISKGNATTPEAIQKATLTYSKKRGFLRRIDVKPVQKDSIISPLSFEIDYFEKSISDGKHTTYFDDFGRVMAQLQNGYYFYELSHLLDHEDKIRKVRVANEFAEFYRACVPNQGVLECTTSTASGQTQERFIPGPEGAEPDCFDYFMMMTGLNRVQLNKSPSYGFRYGGRHWVPEPPNNIKASADGCPVIGGLAFNGKLGNLTYKNVSPGGDARVELKLEFNPDSGKTH